MSEKRILTVSEALREAIREEMQRDQNVFLMGENIGIKGGWGGAGSVVLGLADEFGHERVRDTPISESGFIGAAIGAAMMGMRPIVECSYGDFLFTAMDQILNQAAKMRYISGGQVKVPLVIRAPTGASGRGAQHAQTVESYFIGIPGLKVIVGTSTPYDAKGLLKSSIREDNPVVFCEHKLLYGTRGGFKKEIRGEGATGYVPEEEYTIPLGKADIKREGEDVTVISWLRMLHKSLKVAQKMEAERISLEVIDIRSLVPFDYVTVLESVKKTGKLVIVEESHRSGGAGATIAAEMGEIAFDYLDAPIKRVASLDVPIPFAPALESYVVPTEDKITDAIREIV